jgi:hypothetical protein
MITRILLTLSAIGSLTLGNASADSGTIELVPTVASRCRPFEFRIHTLSTGHRAGQLCRGSRLGHTGGQWLLALWLEPPELEYGEEAVLVHGAYGSNQGAQMKFKVLAELRRNPDSIIGTER